MARTFREVLLCCTPRFNCSRHALQPGTKLGLGVQCIGGGAVRLAPIERHSFTGAAKPLHGREQQLHRLIGGQRCRKAGTQPIFGRCAFRGGGLHSLPALQRRLLIDGFQ